MRLNTNIFALMEGKLNMLPPNTKRLMQLHWAHSTPQRDVAQALREPIEIVNIMYAIFDADFYLDNKCFASEIPKGEKVCSGSVILISDH
jgi:hypothetical protein